MNSGIQDAHNLAWKLARVLAGADAQPLLASYEAERREAVLTSVDRYTDFLTRFGLLAPGFLQNAVGVLFRTGARLGLISRLAPRIGMLDAAYTHSPLVSGKGAWLGRRAPDGDLIAPDGRTVRLLDLAGPQPVLLLFDDGRLPSWDVPLAARIFANIHDLKIVLLLRSEGSRTARCLPRRICRWVDFGTPGRSPAAQLHSFVRMDLSAGWDVVHFRSNWKSVSARRSGPKLIQHLRRARGCKIRSKNKSLGNVQTPMRKPPCLPPHPANSSFREII